MPYEFTAEEFNRFSEDIIKAGGDQASVTSLLADMQGTITEAIAKGMKDSEQVTTITQENERLRKANMDLFLRVGSQAVEQTGGKPKDKGDDPEKPVSTKDYMKNYFEKGEKK